MAKKHARKPSGASRIQVIDEEGSEHEVQALGQESNGSHLNSEPTAAKPKAKKKSGQDASGNFGVGDIKKAVAFVNAVGGLDKAIALLHILKVAKEVQ